MKQFENKIALLQTPVLQQQTFTTANFCDRCGASFSLCHALDCRKGGLVTQHHNEIRDALGDILVTGYNEMLRQLTMRESDDLTNTPALVADLRVRVVWQPQTAALHDVCVVDTDTQSYTSHSLGAVLPTSSHSNTTKTKKENLWKNPVQVGDEPVKDVETRQG